MINIQKETKNNASIIQLLMMMLFFTSCAKELPEYLSDDISQNVFQTSLFNKTVTVETYSDDLQSGRFAIETHDALQRVYALNERKLYPVKMVSGDSKLRPFIKDLMIEAGGAGERREISFNLTENYLVAYINNIESDSSHLRALARGGRAPLFQYPISSWGVLERRENDLGEETRIVEFRTRHRQASTHVRIASAVQNRTYSGLRGIDHDDKEVILKREELDGTRLTSEQLRQWLRNHQAVILPENDTPIYLNVYRGRLYLQVATSDEDLTELERGFLAQNDARISHCQPSLARELAINNCVLRPVYSVQVDHVNLRRRVDRNDLIASVELDRDIHPDQSQFIRLNLDAEVQRDQLGQDFSFIDQVLVSKDQVDLEGEFLYVPISMGTPRDIRLAMPFMQGSEKIVRLNWSEDGLEVFELERDERFANNVLNNKPVLTIPGRHVDFRCRQNANRECIGGDELVDDVTWSERNFFIADIDRLQVLETNLLDLMTLNSPCLQKVNTKMVDYEITPEAINIKMERTYQTANNFGMCLLEHYLDDPEGLSGLSNTTFKAQMHYSLVRLDQLKTEDYQKTFYPHEDHTRFGFFKNFKSQLPNDYDSARMEQRYLLNRWAGSGDANNPRIITYYLNDVHFKPENRRILQKTKLSELLINDALEQAHADIRIRFDVESTDKTPGDLRNNMVILIDEPMSVGLLGYAPSVTNPRTGEIVHGQINMYSGVLRTTARRTWQAMVDLVAKQNNINAHHHVHGSTENSSATDGTGDDSNDLYQLDRIERQAGNTHLVNRNQSSSLSNIASRNLEQAVESTRHLTLQRLRRNDERNVDNNHQQLSIIEQMAQRQEERKNFLARNNVFTDDYLNIASNSRRLLPNINEVDDFFKEVNGRRILKEWDELSDSLKDHAMDLIVPYYYLSVFLHEMGHNLGLRHNFNGSFDKDNFYTAEELRETSQRLTENWLRKNNCANNPGKEVCSPSYYQRIFDFNGGFPYSSIMDYSASAMNQLMIFGKYDIAALRFAYGRKVETQDGQLVDVEGTLTETINRMEEMGLTKKRYRFCTDENAGLTASCNRFEEGSSYSEIAANYIQNYQTYYRYRNFRDGRNSFNEFNLIGYTVARLREFERARNIFEMWEFYADIFDEQVMVTGCGPTEVEKYPICRTINDIRDAALKIGNFFVDIIQSPDHVCAVSEDPQAETPDQFIKLSDIYLNGIEINTELIYRIDYVPHSCFDPAVVAALDDANLHLHGEAGRFLNGFNDNDPRFPYRNDRYALGTWVDRLMATRSLFQRESMIGNTDENYRSLIDIPTIGERFFSLLSDMIFERPLAGGIEFTNENGESITAPYVMKLDNYLIENFSHLMSPIREFFNLPSAGQEYLMAPMLGLIPEIGLTSDRTKREHSRGVVNQITVRSDYFYRPTNSSDSEKSIQLGDRIYRATRENSFAYDMISVINDYDFLDELPAEFVFTKCPSMQEDSFYDENLGIYRLKARSGDCERTVLSKEEAIEEVLSRRAQSPAAPESLTSKQRFIWSIPLPFLQDFASLPQDAVLIEEVVIRVFGDQAGTMILQIFSESGPRPFAEVVTMMREVMNTPPEGASEIVERLYSVNIELLAGYLDGEINDNTIESLEIYLELLPEHVSSRSSLLR